MTDLDWASARRSASITAALRAFTVTMWLVVLVAAGAAANQIAHAHADVLCEHRGDAHAAQQHTTREADSRWHVEHGQLPTCDLDDNNSHDDHDDSAGDGHLLPRRDHEGFHCTWHGCG